jgi:hypothetical protein
LLEKTDAYLNEIREKKKEIADTLKVSTKNAQIQMETINESANELQNSPRESTSILIKNKLS